MGWGQLENGTFRRFMHTHKNYRVVILFFFFWKFDEIFIFSISGRFAGNELENSEM